MLVVVLGMSRSGTSLLMQVLESVGFDCGSDWISTNKNNPRGYYERKPVMNFNIQLLQEASGDTNALFPIPMVEQIERFAGTKIPFQFPSHDYAVKDPRFTLTLPVWLPYLQQFDLRVIYARRREEAIAESLVRAYGTGLDTGYSVIRQYQQRAADLFERYDLHHAELWYEDWFSDPEKNVQCLENLLERPVRFALNEIVDSKLLHCKGTSGPLTDSQAGRVFPSPFSEIVQENLLALQQFHPGVADAIREIIPDTPVRFDEKEGQTDVIIAHDGGESLYSIAEKSRHQLTLTRRYHAYNPQKQWLIIFGIESLSEMGIGLHTLSEFSPIAVIEPDIRKLLAYLSTDWYISLLKLNQLSVYCGSNAIEKIIEDFEGCLEPYFLLCQSVCLIADPSGDPAFLQPIRLLQKAFQRKIQEFQRYNARFAKKYARLDYESNKSAAVVVPSVSCWLTIGRGIAEGFRENGYQVYEHEVSFPPSSISAYDSLRLLTDIKKTCPDYIVTLSHPPDLFVRGIEGAAIKRLVWYADAPGHLIQTKHSKYDYLFYYWREFEDSLKDRGGILCGELPVCGERLHTVIQDDLQCEAGFVGTIQNTDPIRRRISNTIWRQLECVFRAKVDSPKQTFDTLMEQYHIGKEEKDHLVSILEATMRKPGMTDGSLLVFYFHIECARLRRLEIVTQLHEFDLKIFGSADWEPLLRDTPVEGAYQGRGLQPQECYNFYRSATISLNIHPLYLHSGPIPRDIEVLMCDGFLLTDLPIHAGGRLSEFFDRETELAVYSGAEDAVSQVRYYLEHPDEREEISRLAKDRILRDHTYTKRIRRMLERIQELT